MLTFNKSKTMCFVTRFTFLFRKPWKRSLTICSTFRLTVVQVPPANISLKNRTKLKTTYCEPVCKQHPLRRRRAITASHLIVQYFVPTWMYAEHLCILTFGLSTHLLREIWALWEGHFLHPSLFAVLPCFCLSISSYVELQRWCLAPVESHLLHYSESFGQTGNVHFVSVACSQLRWLSFWQWTLVKLSFCLLFQQQEHPYKASLQQQWASYL